MSYFENNLNICVILPAAGCGDRFSRGSDVKLPKQHAIVQGKPLLSYTIDAFLKIKFINKVVVVLDDVLKAQCYTQHPKITFINGKETRHRSIKEGLVHLHSEAPDIVIIHDGVRPLVDEDCVRQLCEMCAENQASGYIRPLVSTIVEPDSQGYLKSVLKRSVYKASETPQAFNFKILWHSYHQCTDEDLNDGTECLDLVLKYAGIHAKLIDGTEDLWKVTYKKDLYAAAQCLADKKQIVGFAESKEFLKLLENDFGSRLRLTPSPEVCHLIFSQKFLASDWVEEISGLVDVQNWGSAICIAEDCETITDVSWALEKFDLIRKHFYIVHCRKQISQMDAGNLIKLAKILKTLLNQMDDSFAGQIFKC